jgi:hypothetical protein
MYVGDAVKSVEDLDTQVTAFYRQSINNQPVAIVFVGKSTKPFARYAFKNEQERSKYVQDIIDARAARIKENQVYKAEQKAKNVVKAQEVQVGDIFHCGWGYSMSLNDFYQVIAKKGNKVTVREIGSEYVSGDWMGGQVKCIPNSFASGSEEMTKLLKGDSFKVSDSRYAYKFDPSQTCYESHAD